MASSQSLPGTAGTSLTQVMAGRRPSASCTACCILLSRNCSQCCPEASRVLQITLSARSGRCSQHSRGGGTPNHRCQKTQVSSGFFLFSADGIPGKPRKYPCRRAEVWEHRAFILQMGHPVSLSPAHQCCLAPERRHHGGHDWDCTGNTWQCWVVAVTLASPS